MPPSNREPEEAITEEEIRATEPPKNAFTELMSPKPRLPTPGTHARAQLHPSKDRAGLGAYLHDPASSARVITYSDDFVAIHDMFPKATVHTLLLPRDPDVNLVHPFDALDDDAFREKIVKEAAKLKDLVARELQRLLGKHSRADAEREAILNGDKEPTSAELPAGRDWSKEVKVGVHAVPSMSHLHVHVLSRDMHSPRMKHRKHYNSFTTPFLVPLEDFPLAEDDPRRRTGEEAYLKWDLKCWRCGRNFRNKFKELKEHLEIEFDEWKKE
ncbi:HIT-like domain-containing protein [Emericellopsis atlantica]|uniref:Aprataxin-like protein n=1 Tax=Emericellopsis atlantica TaxID=2614577 RepID=A0A9P8CQH4_9HYPO|nr:HIT-like domain-containing protein [Emericellopsis atlantica]KAG9255312.1 HIT-like domain-containing protein [Emericellopsis atlantica]